MDINDYAFVLLGRRKFRPCDVESIGLYPTAGFGLPERVVIRMASGQDFTIGATEPHFAQALAIYHGFDAVDLVAESAVFGSPPAAWTPGRVADLLAAWTPERCKLEVSIRGLGDDGPQFVLVVASGEPRDGAPIATDRRFCFCPLCRVRGSYAADVERFKAEVAETFAATTAVPESGRN